jgi:hypothetical protein
VLAKSTDTPSIRVSLEFDGQWTTRIERGGFSLELVELLGHPFYAEPRAFKSHA